MQRMGRTILVSINTDQGVNKMKQKKLVTEMYAACLVNDDAKIIKLKLKEFKKIIKRREEGKAFNPRWTVVR